MNLTPKSSLLVNLCCELEAARDAKMLAFKQETDKLLKQEKPVIEGLNKSIKLREAIKANFELLGIKDQGLKSSSLVLCAFLCGLL